MELQKFKNLIDLLTYFKNEQVCRDYLEHQRKHSESGRFDYFLSMANNYITYKQLIQSHDTDTTAIEPNRYMEGQQGSFSF